MISSSRSSPVLVFRFGLLQIDGQSLLEMFGGFARLAGVGFVDDDGEALAFELGHAGRDDGELLQGGDDDGFARLQRLPQLGGVFIDLLDHAFGLLELLDGVLQLTVEHAPVGDHDDGIEQALGVVGFLIERSELMGKPGDGVGFARTRRMLHEIVLPDAVRLDEFQDVADHIQLVIAGKDKGFGRLFDNGTSIRVV